MIGAIAIGACVSGCALQEVRSKWKLASEWRHSGRSTEEVRYSVEQGFDLRWDKGWTTGVAYRRRDIDDGSGDHDDGLFVDFSFPLWKAHKPDANAQRIQALENRIAQLEGRLRDSAGSSSATGGAALDENGQRSALDETKGGLP
jgi:hypothetical protein